MPETTVSPALRSALDALISEANTMRSCATRLSVETFKAGQADAALVDVMEAAKLLQAAVDRVKNAVAAEDARRKVPPAIVPA